MKLWADNVRPAKRIWTMGAGILLLCCLCFSMTGCKNTPKTVYVKVPIDREVVVEVPVIIEKIVEVPVEVVVEKEVVVNIPIEIEKEVIREVEVVVEKEIKVVETFSDCKIITWEEVLNLKPGDKIEDVFICGNSFVSKFTNELRPIGTTPHWVSNAKDPQAIPMRVCSLKMNYGKEIDYLTDNYRNWGNVGIITGTIEDVIWHTDEYGNKYVTIIFLEKDFEHKTFIDFCPIIE